jgi:hypothetical protein
MRKTLPKFPHNDMLCPMMTSPGSVNCGRGLAAIFISAAFLWALALSVSPQLHDRVHPDANRVEHVCAVTFVTAGQYNHSPALVTTSAGLDEASVEIVSVVAAPLVKSAFLNASIFEHAPPALAQHKFSRVSDAE